MSREIKFRGKRVGNGEWVQGWYLEKDGQSIIYPFDKPGYSYLVVPESVGQYTGLKDKNGVNLDWWDGDVITCQNGIYIEIFWHEKWGQWYGRYINASVKTENPLVEYAVNSYMKVIGNVQENRELLTEKSHA